MKVQLFCVSFDKTSLMLFGEVCVRLCFCLILPRSNWNTGSQDRNMRLCNHTKVCQLLRWK